MVADLWRDVVMKAVLERFSPIALRVLSDERVQNLLTQALNLQADMRENIEAQVKLVARTLELVTRDELTSLRNVVRDLEAEVARLKDELARYREEAAWASQEEASPAGQEEAAPAEGERTPSKPRRGRPRKA